MVLVVLTWKMKKWGRTYLFKQWLELESRKEKIIKSVRDRTDFPSALFDYLDIALPVNHQFYRMGDWTKIVELFYICLSLSPKVELPITTPTDEKHREEDWNYPTRIWYLYSHMLAKNYGWNLQYIESLPVLDALAYIQEILVDEQLDREFYYGLSEIAYEYDKGSKKSKYRPMTRPHWMRAKIKPIEKFKIPASMLPVGNVIMNSIPEDLMPKPINKS